ncbi:MAG: bifunctional ornithine acetyltransferase/N-acetylglutamate synthase, partial [Methanomicrobium sp.]|nr:bifunctional ornithine acetyltransferase/N-acetylglutamate synthase [Methanomicrobium sp.]
VDIDIACGAFEATAWGCDLTEKYVEINGKYTT